MLYMLEKSVTSSPNEKVISAFESRMDSSAIDMKRKKDEFKTSD